MSNSRTPRCRVCEHPKMYCICSALTLWQDANDLPQPVIPFARKKPDGCRHDGCPYPEIGRGIGLDNDGNAMPHKDEHGADLPWLPSMVDGSHYADKIEYLRKMIELAHHDPPLLEDPAKHNSYIVNHTAVTHAMCYLLDNDVDPNVEFIDPFTKRWQTPLRYAATLASEHTKGAIVSVMNVLVQYETYVFSLELTGEFADPVKRQHEHEEIAEREKQERIAHAAGDAGD